VSKNARYIAELEAQAARIRELEGDLSEAQYAIEQGAGTMRLAQAHIKELEAAQQVFAEALRGLDSLTETGQWENVDTPEAWRAYMQAIQSIVRRAAEALKEEGRE
jgi:hypothetical protein